MMTPKKIITVFVLLCSLCFGEDLTSFLTNKTIYLNATSGITSASPIYIFGFRPSAHQNGGGLDLALFNDDGERSVLIDMSYKKYGKYIGYKGIYGGIYNNDYYDKIIPIVINTFNIGKMDRFYVSCSFYFHFPVLAGIKYQVPKLPLMVGVRFLLPHENFLKDYSMTTKNQGLELQYFGKRYIFELLYFKSCDNEKNYRIQDFFNSVNGKNYVSMSVGLNLPTMMK